MEYASSTPWCLSRPKEPGTTTLHGHPTAYKAYKEGHMHAFDFDCGFVNPVFLKEVNNENNNEEMHIDVL